MRLASCQDCTGCGACYNACPANAISMVQDAEGFLQPIVAESKCINCGKCTRSCPILNPGKGKPEQIEKVPLCGYSKSDEVWRKSTSGGAFSEICNALADKNPIVFGARFEGLKVIHDFVEGAEKIALFRKSKYVQTDIGLTFRKCLEFLKAGRVVIFSAAPCQIAGLRLFLGKDYDNLLTIEFICHGSGSPGFFKDCLSVMQRKFGKRIVEYGFRNKDQWPKLDHHTSIYVLENGDRKIISKDLYNKFFLSQLCLRRSCMENCRFRDERRYADITIADCRAERRIYHDKDEKNWSVVLANTEKGKRILPMLKGMVLNPYPIEILKETNPLYFHTTPGNPRRDEFFLLYKGGVSIERIGRKLGLIDPRFTVKRIVRGALRRIKHFILGN